MKRLSTTILILTIIITSFLIGCADKNSNYINSDDKTISPSSNSSTEKDESAIESGATFTNSEKILAENNEKALTLYHVISKAADDLKNEKYDGIDYIHHFHEGEYRIAVNTSAEIPASLKYSTQNSEMTNDETEEMLTYIISSSDEIENGEILVIISKRPEYTKLLYDPDGVYSSSYGTSTYNRAAEYNIKVYYSDSDNSNAIGCNEPSYDEISNYNINNIPDNIKRTGEVQKWFNDYNAYEVETITSRVIEQIIENKFIEIENCSGITPGDYLIDFGNIDTDSFNLDNSDKIDNILTYEGTEKLLKYVLTNKQQFDNYKAYLESDVFTDGIALIRIIKGTEYNSEYSGSKGIVTYYVSTIYSDARESCYLGQYDYGDIEDGTLITDIPLNSDDISYEFSYDRNDIISFTQSSAS